MTEFTVLAFTPAGLCHPDLAIAACRAGGVGIVNGELLPDSAQARRALDALSAATAAPYGAKCDAIDAQMDAALRSHAQRGLQWLVVDAALVPAHAALVRDLRAAGVRVLAEATTPEWPQAPLDDQVDGLLLKGNEAGGFVGEDASFILLQKWHGRTALPLYVRGGLTPHVAAACSAIGVAGGVLESQLLLLDEARLPSSLHSALANLSGSETVAVGDAERGEYFRVLVRPGYDGAREFVASGEGLGTAALRERVLGRADWNDPKQSLLPIGQDVAFAAAWRAQYRHLGAVLKAIATAVDNNLRQAVEHRPVAEAGPLAQALGLRYPLVQGPMTRVSDTAEFAMSVAQGGALPMVAFALLKGEPLDKLLARTKQLLGDRHWGIGLLGFAPQALLDEQLSIAIKYKPDYAIIAGGRPDQAVHLEEAGVPTFLHVPAAKLIPMFLREGARRFIFEGRECGGHIGPLSSFVLWSSMVDQLLAELAPGKIDASEIQLLFAGGVHDAVSSAMVQVLAAPLAARGVKVGVLMGSAYLFTQEIVASGSIVPQFQREVLDCERTINLESGPGHASRCAYTPFAEEYMKKRKELREQQVPGDEARQVLDQLILGRLRIASKGRARDSEGAMQQLSVDEQRSEGMYMLGQVATLRTDVTDIETLHREVTTDAVALLAERLRQRTAEAVAPEVVANKPADIAIVGIASVLPKAGDKREYWENILSKVDAITEIPSHRWDWRLYFDADRNARDKIYSKWGGFLDDLVFDPMKYGMPPKSLESVDPMQLMALEVAQRTLVDAGYHEKAFDRERASVIIGASGGAGDVGTQYGIRSEWPRFNGALPEEVARRLPEWTEDTFAGLLLNVVPGRIASRLNFGGVNFTTDAACASSLAAVYQGVTELMAGRSDFVLAGGVDTVQGPFGYLCFSKTQALSPRGRCSTFSSDGDGIVISEGIAMIAMKRLADAERDGDRIYAVIKGVGGSSDGYAKGLTAPLPAGQLRAMRRAYAQAGFGPGDVQLFEAHGTGTVAGDTAELESTTRLMTEEGAPARHAVIGSVKTNIGHTKATAGVAGLVKAALALQRRVLPPHRNVTTPNAVLADSGAPLYLVDEPTPWLEPVGLPRRAACSAFGFGGTNFHIVLEEYGQEYRDWMRAPASDAWPAELLVWSDADAPALRARLQALDERLAGVERLALRDLAASLATHWRRRGHTLAIVARSVDDLRTKLAAAIAFLGGEAAALPPGVFHGTAQEPAGKVAVLFPGQGSQYPGMGREAALHFQAVADALGQADAALHDAFETRFGTAARLSQFIFPRGAYDDAAKTEARRRLTSTDVAQPALGALEAGLFRLMQSLGLAPDMVAGHSYGEFAALFAAGAIDFDALMQLSAARGRFIVDAASAQGAELGTMAAVSAPRRVVEEAIADLDGVIIANHNAPLQSIISGTREAIKAAGAKLAQAGVEVTEIPVAAAFHSTLVKPAQQALSDLIDATPWNAAQVPVYSNTTARPHASDVARVKRQMADHLVRPVEFVAEVEAMYKDGARVFVEVGPKAVLARLTGRILEGQPHTAIALDDGTGLAGLLAGIGQLLCAGIPLDLPRLFERRDCRIGNPADPAALARVVAVPKHAWMLNGSGARRAGEPVRQVGVTVEQAAAAKATQAALHAASAHAVAQAAPITSVAPPAVQPVPTAARTAAAAQASFVATPTMKRGRSMDERRMAPGVADSSVMSEYFVTMRQFLETQERVMSAFLGESAAGPRPALRARPAPLALPRVSEVPAPVAVPQVAVAAPVAPVVPVAVTAPVAPVAAAPVAKPVEVAPAPVAAAKPAEAPVAAKAGGDALTREKLTDLLLSIVEEKTGYPRDMVGLDQNLEADLGIDSIKRIEVVGALLQTLPGAHRDALTESRSKLNTQPTLNGMLDLVTQAKVGGAVAVPFDSAGVGSSADRTVSHPPRLVMRPFAEPLPADAARRLTAGRFVITRDAAGVADALAASLAARGVEVAWIDAAQLATEAALLERCRVLGESPIAGVVHLATLGAPALDGQQTPVEWRQAIQSHEKSLFLLVREVLPRLVDGAHVVAATGLGGLFGREGSASDALRVESGAVGALKSLRDERPELRVKAVDLDPSRSAAELAADLLGEIELDGGRQEVGYPAGARTVFRSIAEDVRADEAREQALHDLVVVATGGARGITAEVLRELARPGNTLVLTGRSRLVEQEADDTASLADADALRKHFFAQVRAGVAKLTPGEIQRKVQGVLDQREMRANLADFRAAGAAAEYHAVDVTDDAAIGALLADVRQRHGRIDGVVHGAGVIEDKRWADKASDSWSRVVDTKIIGLLLLQKHLDAAQLKFFTVFSSVAGRYGNSGQCDYATANELMNRLCMSLQARWGERVAVSALCWGPWGATKFGAGMVTPETEAKFAEKGVRLVSASLGRRLFRQELTRVAGTPVEVVCGEAPWETREAEHGEIRRMELVPQGASLGPLLGWGTPTSRPTGERIVPVRLDPSRHLYLQEHMMDGKMILPAAAALEMMAEAARTLWPGWCVAEVREHRLMKGVDLERAPRDLQVFVSPPPYGSSEGFEVSIALQSDLGNGRAMTHYRSVVRLEQSLQAPMPAVRGYHDDKALSTAKAYGEWLFHGPRFQVIEQIDGLSPAGAGSRVRSTLPAEWMARGATDGAGWLFDPALLDAAAQMAWLWARAYRDESALPARFGRVVRYRERLPEKLYMEYERVECDDPMLVRGNVTFFDEQGEPVMAIEELDSIASAALNRMGGTARAAEDAAA